MRKTSRNTDLIRFFIQFSNNELEKYEDMKNTTTKYTGDVDKRILGVQFTVSGQHLKMIWVKSEKCSLNYAMGTR